MPFLDGHLRMRVAVTFCDQTERHRGGNEHDYSFFSRSETESVPDFAESETPVLFNHEHPEDSRLFVPDCLRLLSRPDRNRSITALDVEIVISRFGIR